MRIGALWYPNSNAAYRAVDPLLALELRGHQVIWPSDPATGHSSARRLAGCDVVHVYRYSQKDVQSDLRTLRDAGVAIAWDNDDDLLNVDRLSPTHQRFGALRGQRIFTDGLKTARLAHVVSTASEVLAERYRAAGLPSVTVIENQLAPHKLRPTTKHSGVVIGWIAGVEHAADAERLGLAETLRRVCAAFPEVRVETVGVKLDLPADRYRHQRFVPFSALPAVMGGFDIAIAPLADTPFNACRSDIKLKEYAASGVPWLASPVGAYRRHGEAQGGRLVSDDDWFDALARLVARKRERKRLASRGRRWARSQTIDATAERWEQHLARAVEEVLDSRKRGCL